MLQIHDQPEWSNGGCGKMSDEPESPNEGACLRCMSNRNRLMRGRAEDISGTGTAKWVGTS